MIAQIVQAYRARAQAARDLFGEDPTITTEVVMAYQGLADMLGQVQAGRDTLLNAIGDARHALSIAQKERDKHGVEVAETILHWLEREQDRICDDIGDYPPAESAPLEAM